MKPCNKIRYATEKDALFALEKIKEQSVKQKKPIRAYKCYCGAWHLTSRKDLKDIAAENTELKNTIIDLKQKIINIESENDRKIKLKLKRDEKIKWYQLQLNKLQNKVGELRKDVWELIAQRTSLEKRLNAYKENKTKK